MKLILILVFTLPVFFLFSACTQPIANTTLLVSGSNSSSDTTSTTPTEESGQLEIRADVPDMSAPVEDTEKVEISGSCNDLNRKKNRIIVEVFSGENENDTPYISNAISDYCQQSTVLSGNPSTGNGTVIGDKCFWVTNGIGIVEDPNIPTVQKSFPQCHNGRFGFAIRLGGVLTTPAPSGSRYLVRFKLRSLEGQISESTWNYVNITRRLSTPAIDSIVADSNQYFCSLQMSPARFNQNILYSLTRTQTGANTVASVPIFTNLSSAIITSGASAYSYSNDSTTATKIISGATYTYTLSSLENTVYSGGFVYAPSLTATSSPLTCTMPNPAIEQPFAPTNVPIGSGGTGATCYLRFSSSRLVNPGILNGTVGVRWGYSTQAGWTSPTSNNDIVPSPSVAVSNACTNSVCTSTEALDGLAANVTYYFAAQEIDLTIAGGPLRGKWSNEIACKPPSP